MQCKNCKNDAMVTKQGKQSEFCSMSCRSKFYAKSTVKKRTETNMTRYGVDNPSKNPDIIKKRNNTNLEKYGVDNPFKVSTIQQKQQETCLTRYGVRHPSQAPELLQRRDSAMMSAYGVFHNTHLHLSDEILSRLNDDEWLIEQAKIKPATQIAKELGVSAYPIHKRLARLGMNGIVHRSSAFESEVGDWLDSLGLAYVKNKRDVIPPQELDFYLQNNRIAIECNGSYWHSELAGGKSKSYHLQKTIAAFENGVQLIHIWEHDWQSKKDIIQQRLRSKLNIDQRIYARKTTVRPIERDQEKEFLEKYHIQGSCRSKVKLGLFYNNALVAVMTFGRPRFTKNNEWELLRYASASTVVGGASKLFKYFLKAQQPTSVISYSDRQWGSGQLYKQLGFTYTHSTAPSYHYTQNYKIFENRLRYQKHKLKTCLQYFNSEMTEWENMQINGFDRIWDCGNDVWVWNC